MKDKQNIAYNFSKSADTYDEHAKMQQFASDGLFELLGEYYQNILEIGCGSGYLSKKIADEVDFDSFDCVDLSSSMLEIAKSKISKNRNKYNFLCKDAENMEFTKKYDLVISNMCLHWFEDLGGFLRKLQAHNIKNIAFTLPLDTSFGALKILLNKYDIPDFFLKLPNLDETLNLLSSLTKEDKILTKKTTFIEKFQNPISFFKSLQATGVGGVDKKYSYQALRKIASLEFAIEINYDILIVKLGE